MKVTEKELEDVIFYQHFQNVEDSGLITYRHDKVVRQLSLGSFGRPDLVGFDFIEDEKGRLSEVLIKIYELKSDHVSFESLCQVQKYQYALRQMLMHNPRYKGIDIQLSTALIGFSIDNCVDFMAAAAELEIALYTYDKTIGKIIFNKIYTHKYKPDSYERTWFGEGNRLNLFKLFNGDQDVIFDPDRNESWIKMNKIYL